MNTSICMFVYMYIYFNNSDWIPKFSQRNCNCISSRRFQLRYNHHVQVTIKIHWVLPSLWKTSIIPKDRAMIISQFAFLDILSNGIRSFFGRNFHFGLSVLWNFIDEIIEVATFKRDIMPW
jgi:hypothetical protein